MTGLTDREREAYGLRHGEGLKLREVAQRMGICRQRVSQLLKRARQKIRQGGEELLMDGMDMDRLGPDQVRAVL